MQYTEVQFSISPYSVENTEILIAWLAELPFDSFTDTETGTNAYAPTQEFSEKELLEKIEGFSLFEIKYTIKEIEDQNWNKVWEENYFEPIVIGDQCLVRGSFHENTPEVKWEIIIDPKMSFGSGHHSTTKMMLEHLLDIDVKDKSLLDMGCGTGILAILASMRGAKNILAIDIDEWAYNNAIENAQNNKQEQIEVLQGGVEKIGDRRFDIILANINTNVLLADMQEYKNALNPNGKLILSGFYSSDKEQIETKAKQQELNIQMQKTDNDWCSIAFK